MERTYYLCTVEIGFVPTVGKERLATRKIMTKGQKEQAIGLLFAEKCSCVIRNGDSVRIFRERGVADLYRLLHEEPALLRGGLSSPTRSWAKVPRH